MAVADRNPSWMVDDADFPAAGDTEDLLRFALRYAVLAPSSHNSQPWLFRVDGKAVEVYADRSRRLPVVDPDDRELVMSCGAALYNLRLALSHIGEGVDVSILPSGVDGDLLARVELSGRPVPPNAQTEDLFSAITNRHTCRRAFDQTPVEQKIVHDLRNAAFAEGAWLFDVPDKQRNKVTGSSPMPTSSRCPSRPSAASWPIGCVPATRCATTACRATPSACRSSSLSWAR